MFGFLHKPRPLRPPRLQARLVAPYRLLLVALLAVLIIPACAPPAEPTATLDVVATAAPAAGCTPRDDWPQYTVIAGDSLLGIAGRVGAPVDTLAGANCLPPMAILAVGQRLYVPALPPPLVDAVVELTSTPGTSGSLTRTLTGADTGVSEVIALVMAGLDGTSPENAQRPVMLHLTCEGEGAAALGLAWDTAAQGPTACGESAAMSFFAPVQQSLTARVQLPAGASGAVTYTITVEVLPPAQ